MGTWGTGILDDDMAVSVYESYMDLFNSQKSHKEIRIKLEQSFADGVNDPDDKFGFWFALAKGQWECGVLEDDVLNLVNEFIVSGAELNSWRERSENNSDYSSRKRILNQFQKTISKKKLKPRQPIIKSTKKVIGKKLPGPKKLRVGDIIAIPIKSGFGYGRIYKDADIGIINLTSKSLLELSDIKGEPIKFIVGFCEPWDHPTWIYLGKWSFDRDEEAWGPPKYVQDVINPNQYRLYHKGIMRTCHRKETEGLEKAVLYSPTLLADRIIKEIK